MRIHEEPNNIEELTELREWMRAVPEQLAVQEVGHTLPMGTEGSGGENLFVQCLVSQKQKSTFFAYVCLCMRGHMIPSYQNCIF